MIPKHLDLLLAEDDTDDCVLFESALESSSFDTTLKFVYDGEQLMKLLLLDSYVLPDVLFLDLNMPRKNGLECLSEIRHYERIRALPVVIFSTSYDESIVNLIYKNGAIYYFSKPPEFSQLRKLIQKALTLIAQNTSIAVTQPIRGNFVLTA